MSAEDIINNPPKEFTEPCECCGVSEFQLGVKHAEERIIKLFEDIKNEPQRKQENWLYKVARTAYANAAIALIKGETE